VNLRFTHARDVNALPAAERALAIDPSLAEALCVKARYLEEEGRVDEAERDIRSALQLSPESWEVNREAAIFLFRRSRIPDAIPLFEKATLLMEVDWSAPMMLITCYTAIGDKAKARRVARTALERAERAIARDPTNGPALAVGALALAMSGETERAREWIQRALVLDPDNLTMRYNLACSLLLEIGDAEEALETLEPFFERTNSPTLIRHLEVDPDLDSIRKDRRFIEMVAAAKKRLGITDAAE